MGKIVAVYYDREHTGKRIGANAAAIRGAVNGQLELELQCVDRPAKFMSCASAYEMLMSQGDYPFDVFVINGAADYSPEVLETAVIGFELHEVPYNRIVYLPHGPPDDSCSVGISCVPTTGGNGHLSPSDAQKLYGILTAISQEMSR
ncbi:hypothetical protein HYU10_03090 [Candidatus Woesearchaeota archaeon]|nr:hypothetical protein [Candidatus Woesearchaeota archaeon]MBI2130731.1 hypothetical protein [Candidatus Woesearchaeota archaeon]